MINGQLSPHIAFNLLHCMTSEVFLLSLEKLPEKSLETSSYVATASGEVLILDVLSGFVWDLYLLSRCSWISGVQNIAFPMFAPYTIAYSERSRISTQAIKLLGKAIKRLSY